jgi:hypothetical protein
MLHRDLGCASYVVADGGAGAVMRIQSATGVRESR